MAFYKTISLKEFADLIHSMKTNKHIDFTFDMFTNEEIESGMADPCRWHGVKKLNFFNEAFGTLAFGYYGGDSIQLYCLKGNTVEEVLTYVTQYIETSPDINTGFVTIESNNME